MRTSLILLALVAALGVTPALAQNCSDSTNQTAMNECYGQEYETADKLLNATYVSLMDKMSAAGKKRLEQIQRSWSDYKEGWCKFEASPVESGTIYPSILAQCLTRLTNEQLERLSYQNTCSEDVDCARFAQ
jgi:uncharacterized protein YecT (DUF1311 family)